MKQTRGLSTAWAILTAALYAPMSELPFDSVPPTMTAVFLYPGAGMKMLAAIALQCPQYIHHILTVRGEALL